MRAFSPARSPQIALIANPVKSLQAIAARTRVRTPAAKIRPALSILPNSVIPLAVSLWQRQPAHARSSAASVPQAAQNIVVQRSIRFQTSAARSADADADAGFCQRSRNKQTSKRNVFQVCFNDRIVGEFSTQTQADEMANRLRQWLSADQNSDENKTADRLQLQLVDDRPVVKADDMVLFSIDSRTAKSIWRNRELIAIEWLNQLRHALNAEPLSIVDAQMQLHGLSEQPQGELNGIASWYGPYFHGRLTAAGEIFNQNELTAAHPSLPFGTFLKVTNLETGRAVIVRINDRGPYVGSRSLDLSRQAARSIGSEESGVINYAAEILTPQPIAQERPATAAPDAIAFNSTR